MLHPSNKFSGNQPGNSCVILTEYITLSEAKTRCYIIHTTVLFTAMVQLWFTSNQSLPHLISKGDILMLIDFDVMHVNELVYSNLTKGLMFICGI